MSSSNDAAYEAKAVDVKQTLLESEIAELVVSVLNLPLVPSDIDPQTPMYAEGLGLDSIDLLEIAMEITGRYGFQLRSNEASNASVFASIRSLAAHVEEHRGTDAKP